jgi:hypothetical protein
MFRIFPAPLKDRVSEIADLARTLESDIEDRKARLQAELDEVHGAQIALHSVVNTSVL